MVTPTVFSTSTYCTSRFGGPITERIEDLAARYDDHAEFVHVEIWKSFADRTFNEAVAESLVTDDGGNEPWVFLIDGNGTITQRWTTSLTKPHSSTTSSSCPPADHRSTPGWQSGDSLWS